MPRFRPRLTFANVTSLLALFVALGSGAYAAVQLPKNSVGTKQLKKDAVISTKVKDGTINGADVNEASLGRVPSAAKATSASTAGNASKLGGVAPDAYTKDGEKVANAGHADTADSATSATTAGDASTVGGLAQSAFVHTDTTAGGALAGPFSNLTLNPDVVSGGNVVDGSLNSGELGDYSHAGVTLTDGTANSVPAEHTLTLNDLFTISLRCNREAANAVRGTMVIKAAVSNWALDSTGQNGDSNQVDLQTGDERKLIELGPTATDTVDSGTYVVIHPTNTFTSFAGHVGVRINRNLGECQFYHAAFGSSAG